MSQNYGSVKSDKAVYYFGGPSDVQFDPSSKWATEEYTDMKKDIPAVVKTFTIDKM